MITIESAADLVAVSGGVAPLSNVKLKVTLSPSPSIVLETDLQTGFNIAFGAFDQLQTWGGDLGIAIFDATHRKK